jgi:hypothetical protein
MCHYNNMLGIIYLSQPASILFYDESQTRTDIVYNVI